MKKYYPQDEPNYVSFEGYLNAKILIKGLEGAGKHLTRKGFIKSLESIKDLSIGIGQPINFGPEDHQGFDTIYFSQIKDGKIVLVTAWDVEI
ncbi:MAG: ABC transporter substrate-binding protein [Desulfobacteraceae bacterium]|nr:ABC transporter substrate-binding protein [Desulfobacteraceae bacterium]